MTIRIDPKFDRQNLPILHLKCTPRNGGSAKPLISIVILERNEQSRPAFK